MIFRLHGCRLKLCRFNFLIIPSTLHTLLIYLSWILCERYRKLFTYVFFDESFRLQFCRLVYQFFLPLKCSKFEICKTPKPSFECLISTPLGPLDKIFKNLNKKKKLFRFFSRVFPVPSSFLTSYEVLFAKF